ncbi:hypothetical protein J1605_005490 [Eschrichtius robustus]|uniref:Uncharacterized protein n=1 Tax=Eschrichtius robustus TaxID=9764 RepID=A0AB34H8X9_ESCRO|nr:hypothetical protein J1605_005490 [Eschrichtius robustus]
MHTTISLSYFADTETPSRWEKLAINEDSQSGDEGNSSLFPLVSGTSHRQFTVLYSLGDSNSAIASARTVLRMKKLVQGLSWKIKHLILIWKTFPCIALLKDTSFRYEYVSAAIDKQVRRGNILDEIASSNFYHTYIRLPLDWIQNFPGLHQGLSQNHVTPSIMVGTGSQWRLGQPLPSGGLHSQGGISRIAAITQSSGCHSDPPGAGLCLVHMALSVGTPQSASRGPALPSRQPAPDTGGLQGRETCRLLQKTLSQVALEACLTPKALLPVKSCPCTIKVEFASVPLTFVSVSTNKYIGSDSRLDRKGDSASSWFSVLGPLGTAEGDPLKRGASGGPDCLDRRVPLSPGIQPESGPGVAIQTALQVDAQVPITSAGHGDPDGSNPLHEATATPCPPAFSLPAPTPATAYTANNHGHAKSLLGKNSFSTPFATKPGERCKSTELSALS